MGSVRIKPAALTNAAGSGDLGATFLKKRSIPKFSDSALVKKCAVLVVSVKNCAEMLQPQNNMLRNVYLHPRRVNLSGVPQGALRATHGRNPGRQTPVHGSNSRAAQSD